MVKKLYVKFKNKLILGKWFNIFIILKIFRIRGMLIYKYIIFKIWMGKMFSLKLIYYLEKVN